MKVLPEGRAARARRSRRRDAARAQMYRRLVFEAAEHVFARKGFEATTMQDLAAEAGISLKTLYAAFPGKQEIFLRIHEERVGAFVQRIAEALGAAGSPLDRLERGVRAYLDFLLAHPDYLRIHLRERTAWGLLPEGAAGAAGAQDWWRAGRGAFAEVLRQGMAAGLFHEGDAELMASMGIAVMQVQLARLADLPGRIDADAACADVLLQLRRLLCRPERV
jgi:AcrR family transcriptional regulator